MNNCVKTQVCRLCGSNQISDFISFGDSPPANSYCRTQEESLNQEKFSLTAFLCDSCYSVQLRETVSPSLLFRDYKYASSTVVSLDKYFEKYTEDLINDGYTGRVLEIGSNDGVLLNHLRNARFQVLGVEPSDNLAKIANERGLPTICEFFNEKLGKEIVGRMGKYNLIVANNVFAHIPDLRSVVKGVNEVISNDGVFVFENAYLLDTINGLHLGQFYFEHVYYHSIIPIKNFLEGFGFEIFKIQHTSAQGGSIRVFTQKIGGKRSIDLSVGIFVSNEKEFYKSGKIGKFGNDVNRLSVSIKSKIDEIIKEGKTISLYGVAAKLTTLAVKFGLNHENCLYAVDESPLKIGLYTPNGIKIVSKDYFTKNPTDYCIITAGNYAKLIKANNQGYKGEWINPEDLV